MNMNQGKYASRRSRKFQWWMVGAVCVIAAAGCLLALFVRYDGRLYYKYSKHLDLSSRELTLDDYDHLTGLLPGCEITWKVPLQDQRLEEETQTVRLEELHGEDLRALEMLPELTRLELGSCPDPELLEPLGELTGVTVSYMVPVGTEVVPNDTESLVWNDARMEDVRAAMPHLSRLKSLQFTGTLPESGALLELARQYPQVECSWSVALSDRQLERTTKQLDMTGQRVDGALLELALGYLDRIEQVDLTGTGLSNEDYCALVDAYPDVRFTGELTIGNVTASTAVEELDISDNILTGVEEIESLLPYFPNLRKVIMCRCGIGNEEMDALNKRYADIRFVWEVTLMGKPLRTDATSFIAYPVDALIVNTATDEDVAVLWYCEDMVALDCGHWCSITHCEWVRAMPNLKYFIIGETSISDLTPLSTCKNLVWLELFTTPVTDYSPLLGCTALEDLCLGKTYADPEPISKMTWLKHLWWYGVKGRTDVPARTAPDILPDALPNTVIKFDLAHSTGNGWHQLPNYYAMRDALGMFYMN